MTATSHAVIGVVIASQFSNPVVAIPLAFFSHIAADLFPHWDSGTHKKTKSKARFVAEAVIDVLLGLVVSYGLIIWLFPQTNLLYAFFCIISAQLLDWLWAPYRFLGWNFLLFKGADFIAKLTNNKMDKPWGIIFQVWALLLLIGFAIVL